MIAYVARSVAPLDGLRNISFESEPFNSVPDLSIPIFDHDTPEDMKLEEKLYHGSEDLPFIDIVAVLLADSIRTWKDPSEEYLFAHTRRTCVRNVCFQLQSFVKIDSVWASWVALRTFMKLAVENNARTTWKAPAYRVLRDERTVAESAFVPFRALVSTNGTKSMLNSNDTITPANSSELSENHGEMMTSIALHERPASANVTDLGYMHSRFMWEKIFGLNNSDRIPWSANSVVGSCATATEIMGVVVTNTRVFDTHITNEMVGQALYNLWLKIPDGFVGHWIGVARLNGVQRRHVFLRAGVTTRPGIGLQGGAENTEVNEFLEQMLKDGETDIVQAQQGDNETLPTSFGGASDSIQTS